MSQGKVRVFRGVNEWRRGGRGDSCRGDVEGRVFPFINFTGNEGGFIFLAGIGLALGVVLSFLFVILLFAF